MNLTQYHAQPAYGSQKKSLDYCSYPNERIQLPSIHSLFPDIFPESANRYTTPTSTVCSTPSMTNSSPKIPHEDSPNSSSLSSQSPFETNDMTTDESMLCTTFSLDEGLTDLPSDCFKVLVPSGHRPLAPKRKRANAKQLEVLQQIYEVNKFPNAILREQLAKQLGMTTRGIQIWFQNQRQGAKDRTKTDNIKHSSSSPSPSSSHQYKMVY